MNILLVIFLTTLLFPATSLAKNNAIGLGAGVTYAGILGVQFSSADDIGRVRLALGLVGVSAGYDYFITRKCSMGGSIIYSLHLGDRVNGSAGVNCGFKPDQNGFNIGFEITTYQPDFSVNGDNDNLKTEVTPSISIGYRF